jgi:hypothetical protein
VQFEKNSFTNRNKIRTAQGWCWLTVPVKTGGRFGDLALNKLEIDNSSDWRNKHWQTILQNYRKSAHFSDYGDFLENIYKQDWNYLIDLCQAINGYILKELNLNTMIIFSSSLKPQGAKDKLVLELCRKTGASIYISGIMGKQYLDEADFMEAGIGLNYQDYRHPQYAQFRGDDFISHLSIVDLLFNCGNESRKILMNGRAEI